MTSSTARKTMASSCTCQIIILTIKMGLGCHCRLMLADRPTRLPMDCQDVSHLGHLFHPIPAKFICIDDLLLLSGTAEMSPDKEPMRGQDKTKELQEQRESFMMSKKARPPACLHAWGVWADANLTSCNRILWNPVHSYTWSI
ncbi:uncharacterized protein LOC144024554 [Festucalex cinctus]